MRRKKSGKFQKRGSFGARAGRVFGTLFWSVLRYYGGHCGGFVRQAMNEAAASQKQVTQILQQVQAGHVSAAERLLPLVYEELRILADHFFRHERADHTLQPTALVHEAYVRLVNPSETEWTGRAHFFAAAANAMRRILINHAEARNTIKRGGTNHRVTLSDDTPAADRMLDVELLALNEALEALEALDPRQCRIVELRFFSGLTVDQVAQMLNVSTRLVEAEWHMARAWLYRRLRNEPR